MRIDARTDVADWAARAAIDRSRVREALLVVGAIATSADWRRFLDRTLAWLGAVALATALVFFIAANWQALGRFGKLALIETVVVAALGVVAWQGLDSLRGRTALLFAAIVVGALLAFVGQTYQTGADTHELFVAWAIAILPWALVARQPALWLLWVALLDVALWFYRGLSFDWLGLLVLGQRAVLWMMLALHVVALAAWELGRARGRAWLDAPYAVRTLAIGAGACATILVVEAIAAGAGGAGRRWTAMLAWLALIAALYYAYRVRRVDLFVLAACVLSAIVVIVAALIAMGVLQGLGGLLVVGLVILALAAGGAHWLRALVREPHA